MKYKDGEVFLIMRMERNGLGLQVEAKARNTSGKVNQEVIHQVAGAAAAAGALLEV